MFGSICELELVFVAAINQVSELRFKYRFRLSWRERERERERRGRP